jgi:Uma2 family endonuclease
MASPAPKRMTVAEFLEWDDGTDTRYELVAGRIVAMAPPVEDHGAIVGNLTFRIGNRLTPPHRAVLQAGIALPGRDDAWYQADLAVTCAPPARGRCHVAEPVLIVEVLSPSTMQHDRGTKLPDYCDLPSVREILLVSSTERRVELWRRDGPRWIVESLIGEAELRLEAIDAAIPLAAVYENVAVS